MPDKKSKIKNQKSKMSAKSLGQKAKSQKLKSVPTAQKSLKAPKPEKAKEKTSEGIQTDVYDVKGKVVEKIGLPKEIFGQKENKKLVSQAIRVYLANKRSGTASTKTRGEVNKTTAKVWRQKGTGRARHGAKSAPIWVGGGIAFGPKPRDFHLLLPKKMRNKALFVCLSGKLRDGDVAIVSGIKAIEPKTKNMAEVLHTLFPAKKAEKILLVTDSQDAENVLRAARNIQGLEISPVNMLNPHNVLLTKRIIFAKEAIEPLTKQFIKNV